MSFHRSLSLGRSGSAGSSRFINQPNTASITRSIVDAATAAAAPDHGVDFRFIECGSSEVDKLMDNGGGFESFGDYVRAEAAFQRSGHNYADDLRRVNEYDEQRRTGISRSVGHEKVLRWRSAANAYRRWAADQVYPSVRRAISSPDGMFEQNDPDGGAVVPPHFIMEVWDKARSSPSPFAMAKVVVVPTVAGILPGIQESSRVTGSRWGGLTGYWLEEGQQITTTIPLLQNSQYRLKKLAVLVPATDEMYEDSALFDSFLTEVCSKELSFQLNQAIFSGTAGTPNGMVNGPATISIAKDTGQAAATISASNVSNMWQRLHGPSRANACWFSHQDFDVDSLALPVTNMTGWNGPQEAPTLKGRPVYPLEQCPALGSSGDLLLTDCSQYLVTMMGIRKSISAHLRFAYGETYMKLILRVDGQSLWSQPITPPFGTLTKSPFITIQQR